MGFISVGVEAVRSTLKDVWKDYIYCDALDNNTLVTKGLNRNSSNGNILSDQSKVIVSDGQCLLVVENGKVIDLVGEPGEYIYDKNAEPSIFLGGFKDAVKSVFSEIGSRFSYGGQAGQDQRVYFINIKEITGLKYGTPNPIPFRVVEEKAGIDMDISLKAFGTYSIRIVNPVLFYTNVSGNVENDYNLDTLNEQLRAELLTALQPALAKLSDQGIRYSQIPGHTEELAQNLNEQLSSKWTDLRGIQIVSFGVNSIVADENDEATLKSLQKATAFRDPNLAAANIAAAQAQAMQDAAKNPNGAMMGYVGLNAAQQAGGIDVNELYKQGGQWLCPSCQTANEGKFCSNCGTKKPE
ncbi:MULTISPECIES: SPFH domain-containing protein [Terrabacteria group]|uniref:SPFH domain-containing protein n=1 Tax=Bacillati TaxID=1783272 RepID=UPI001C6E59EF|nr:MULTISPECIES: SPFH domain-containing protein [Terrabacteria group]MBW9212756.1 SPFH domain-containing protein [Trueperella sp. zg.1013]